MESLDKLGEHITNEICNGIPLQNLTSTFATYIGHDWKKYIVDDKNIPYSKKCAFQNEYIEIIIISWGKNKHSKIHDHPSGGCLLKIMEGCLVENVYILNNNFIEFSKVNHLQLDQISYQVGTHYLHSISNENDTITVSIHIYSPPNYKIKYYE